MFAEAAFHRLIRLRDGASVRLALKPCPHALPLKGQGMLTGGDHRIHQAMQGAGAAEPIQVETDAHGAEG